MNTCQDQPIIQFNDLYDDVKIRSSSSVEDAIDCVFQEQSELEEKHNWIVKAIKDFQVHDICLTDPASEHTELVLYRKGG